MSKGSIQAINFRLLHLIYMLKIFCGYKGVEEANCPQTDQTVSRCRIRIWNDVLLECKTQLVFPTHAAY